MATKVAAVFTKELSQEAVHFTAAGTGLEEQPANIALATGSFGNSAKISQ